eukprot:10823794-Alexandrium_andersonii.AAC.1
MRGTIQLFVDEAGQPQRALPGHTLCNCHLLGPVFGHSSWRELLPSGAPCLLYTSDAADDM